MSVESFVASYPQVSEEIYRYETLRNNGKSNREAMTILIDEGGKVKKSAIDFLLCEIGRAIAMCNRKEALASVVFVGRYAVLRLSEVNTKKMQVLRESVNDLLELFSDEGIYTYGDTFMMKNKDDADNNTASPKTTPQDSDDSEELFDMSQYLERFDCTYKDSLGIITDVFPLMGDIIYKYESFRNNGKSNTESLVSIYREYREDMEDDDDGAVIIIAMAIALCGRKEAVDKIIEEAGRSIEYIVSSMEPPERVYIAFDSLKALFSSDDIYVNSGKKTPPVKIRKKYKPDWEIGDTFIHEVTPSPKNEPFVGQYIIFRKIGEYVDKLGYNVQLVYVSLCSADKIPDSDEALHSLGFVRMMQQSADKWYYIAQIVLSGKKSEESWELKKIGNFPNAGHPTDAAEEDPVTSMPMIGRINRKNCAKFGYEDFVTFFIKQYGIGY